MIAHAGQKNSGLKGGVVLFGVNPRLLGVVVNEEEPGGVEVGSSGKSFSHEAGNALAREVEASNVIGLAFWDRESTA